MNYINIDTLFQKAILFVKVTIAFILFLLISSCDQNSKNWPNNKQEQVIIYSAKNIITMNNAQPPAHIPAQAVAVKDGIIVGIGQTNALKKQFAHSKLDTSFNDKIIIPGLIDPHIHLILGAMMYSTPMVPPWDLQTPDGLVKGAHGQKEFLQRLTELGAGEQGAPLLVYGYHNLVHGDLDRHVLDKIAPNRALIIWHYSGHDFYLNSRALKLYGIDASWNKKFKGVPLGADGLPSGRVYEDAVFDFLHRASALLLAPEKIQKGMDGLLGLFARSGVTSIAEMGYGLFGIGLEDKYYASFLPKNLPTRIYLVPEHRAFAGTFKDNEINEIKKRVAQTKNSNLRVLPAIKLFTDAAFYSQTMRVDPPYQGGQNKGGNGLWVMGPQDKLEKIIAPLWQAGLDIHIHSNGDAAQTASIGAFEKIVKDGRRQNQKFIIEHGGIITPEQLSKISELNIGLSFASHYVFYMGDIYKPAIGERVDFITPAKSAFRLNIKTTLHSDAPLAPPVPLLAASVHMSRTTGGGLVANKNEQLSQEEALKAVTINAAYSLGLEKEIGSIEIGKKADFTILDKNPLLLSAEDWPKIKVWGVVLGGEKHPVPK